MIRILLASLFLTFTVSAQAKARPSTPPVDRDYVAALATADRFLHAWQTQDEESGLLLLTDRVRRRTDESALQDFFSASRARSSFEIARGKKLAPGRYQFPVSLFEGQSETTRRWTRPQASTLIVVKAGKDDWAIDKLP